MNSSFESYTLTDLKNALRTALASGWTDFAKALVNEIDARQSLITEPTGN